MTPKQEERIRNKIVMIRKALAADKKRWGGYYDDSRGLRYLPPELFIKLKDYKGGLRYLRWFSRAFPHDSGYPIFLFQWTLILFKTGNVKEAEKKAYQTYFSNNYLFDVFLGKERLPIEKSEYFSWTSPEMAEELKYEKSDPEFADFAAWLDKIHSSEKFNRFTHELKEIGRQLETEPLGPTRSALVDRRYGLMDELFHNSAQ